MPVHRLRIFKEKFQCLWQDDKVAECGAAEEEPRAERGRWKNHRFFLGCERWENELGQKNHDQGKRKNQAGVEGKLERDREGVRHAERLQIRRPLRIHRHERMLNNGRQLGAEDKGEEHPGHQRGRDFDDREAQVFYVGEEGLRFIPPVAKSKELFESRGWSFSGVVHASG